MTKETIKKASEIIFANEGGYSSVNANDNGAVSVGRIQWHGTRALNLLKEICTELGAKMSVKYLGDELYTEIVTVTTWSTRIVSSKEASRLSDILSTTASHKVQDEQADEDVTAYLVHVENLGVTEENAQIFMADIENQGGAGASARIIRNSCGYDIDSLYESAINDTVFRNYIPRRNRVYTVLMGHAYGEEPYNGTVYIVQSGDTLSKIGTQYGVSWKDLAEFNNITDPNRITVGDMIKIPSEAAGAPEDDIPTIDKEETPIATMRENSTLYVVAEGDRLSDIGKAHGVDWHTLAEFNAVQAPYIIYIGQTLFIPHVTVDTLTHTVVKGDTLSAISKKYGVSVDAIVNANLNQYPKITKDYIVVGWKLTIPKEGQ